MGVRIWGRALFVSFTRLANLRVQGGVPLTVRMSGNGLASWDVNAAWLSTCTRLSRPASSCRRRRTAIPSFPLTCTKADYEAWLSTQFARKTYEKYLNF